MANNKTRKKPSLPGHASMDGYYSARLNLFNVKTAWGVASCEHEGEVGTEDYDGPVLAEENAFGVHHYG